MRQPVEHRRSNWIQLSQMGFSDFPLKKQNGRRVNRPLFISKNFYLKSLSNFLRTRWIVLREVVSKAMKVFARFGANSFSLQPNRTLQKRLR